MTLPPRSPVRLCILVRFALRPGARPAFLELVAANAAASVALEPGCTRFDVLEGDETDEVVLYELYDDAGAFAAHLASAHFRSFETASSPLVATKTVERLRAHEHAE